jgi:hypothetical protein
MGRSPHFSAQPTLPPRGPLCLRLRCHLAPPVIPTRVRSTLLSSVDRRAHVGSGSRVHVTVFVAVMWGPCASAFLTPRRVCIPVIGPTLSTPLNAIAGRSSSATIAIPSVFDSKAPGFMDKTRVRCAIPTTGDRLPARAINLVTGEWRNRERERGCRRDDSSERCRSCFGEGKIGVHWRVRIVWVCSIWCVHHRRQPDFSPVLGGTADSPPIAVVRMRFIIPVWELPSRFTLVPLCLESLP